MVFHDCASKLQTATHIQPTNKKPDQFGRALVFLSGYRRFALQRCLSLECMNSLRTRWQFAAQTALVKQGRDRLFVGGAGDRLAEQIGDAEDADIVGVQDRFGRHDGIGDHQLAQF